MIDDSRIAAALLGVDLRDVLRSRLVHTERKGFLFARCPFHTEPRGRRSLQADKSSYICRVCGAFGSALHFLMEKDGRSIGEGVTYLERRARRKPRAA